MKKLSLGFALAITLAATTASADTPGRASAGGTLRLDARLSHAWVPVKEAAHVFATIRISGVEFESEDRAPLNLSVVVDRSTSMADGRLTRAVSATHQLIDMLGPQDTLSIVSYGSDVRTMTEPLQVTPSNKELLHNAASRISLSGSTNLSGGYERGKSLVLSSARDNAINRVILLSDGHANVGVTDNLGLGALAKRGMDVGVSLTTMGIGLDYNEELMTTMAKQGAGNYYFIEHNEQIAKMFDTEFRGLASTVARNTVLTIEPAPGVELLEVFGFAAQMKGPNARVPLSAFFANQQKDVLVKLAVSPQAAGALDVLSARLAFDDVTQNDRSVHSKVTVAAVATADKTKLRQTDRAVLRRVQQVQTATAFDQAMTEYEKGNAAKAAEIAARQRTENRSFQKQYDFEDDEAFGRVDGELQALEQDVRKTDRDSKEGKRMRKAKKSRAYKIGLSADAF